MHRFSRREVLGAGAIVAGTTAFSTPGAARQGDLPGLTDWPQHQFDGGNTGHDPDAVGPTSDPARRWSHSTFGSLGRMSGPALDDGQIYLPGNGGNLWAIEADGGDVIGHYETDADAFQSNPAVAAGRVVVGDRNGTLHAVSVEGGEAAWTYDFRNETLVASPAVADGTVYLAEDPVVALDAATGEELWRNTAVKALGTAAVADGAVYAYQNDSNDVYVFDAGNGDLLAEVQVPARLDHHCQPTVGDDHLYLGGVDNTVVALERGTGAVAWTFEVEGVERDRFFSSPALHDGTLYFGSTDRSVYAVDAADGSERWSVRTGDQVNASPTVANGVVYVGNDGSTVLALDHASGDELWRYDLGEGPIVGQLVPSGKRLFVPYKRGGIVALGPGDGDSTGGSSGSGGGSATSGGDPGTSDGSDGGSTGGSGDGSDGGTGDSGEPQRGFFSNSEGDEPDFLSNMFNLTVLGFLLSIAGIVHQMIGGD